MKRLSQTGSLRLPGVLLLAVLVMSWPAAGQQFEKQEFKSSGVLVERFNELFTLRDYRGLEFKVEVNMDTEIEEQKSNFFRDPKQYSVHDLIPGLDVRVKGFKDSSGKVVDQQIKFTQNALKVAKAIVSQIAPIEQNMSKSNTLLKHTQTRVERGEHRAEVLSGQVGELTAGLKLTRSDVRDARRQAEQASAEAGAAHHRISALDEYKTEELCTLHFAFNSWTLSAEDQSMLDRLAATAKKRTGYLIEVKGFASADGDTGYNHRLSQRRADQVVEHLLQQIPMRHLVTPYGYGSNLPVADNETLKGRQENRRVEIRLLINRGLDQTLDTARLTSGQVKRF